MLSRSLRWDAALAGSHTSTLRVDSWLDGKLLAADMPVAGGSISMKTGGNPRATLSVSFTDPSGLLSMDPGGAVACDGQELRVRMGVKVGAYTESVQVGVFGIQTASADLELTEYGNPFDPGHPIYVRRGLVVDVDASDRAQRIADDKLMVATQPKYNSVLVEIPRLLAHVVPWRRPAMDDVLIPMGLTYDADRLKAIQDLADVLDADLIVDAVGVATLQARALSPSVWTIAAGKGGTLTGLRKVATRDGVYNAVCSRSSGSGDAVAVQSIARVTSGVQRYGGPYGRKPEIHSSALLTTRAQVAKDATDTLRRLRTQLRQVIPVTCLSNPALQPHDVVSVGIGPGFIDGEVLSITLPLDGSEMALQVAVDPDVLALVA